MDCSAPHLPLVVHRHALPAVVVAESRISFEAGGKTKQGRKVGRERIVCRRQDRGVVGAAVREVDMVNAKPRPRFDTVEQIEKQPLYMFCWRRRCFFSSQFGKNIHYSKRLTVTSKRPET